MIFWVVLKTLCSASLCTMVQLEKRPESVTALPQQCPDLFSHPGFLVGMHPETFINSDTIHAEVDVGEHRCGVLL